MYDLDYGYGLSDYDKSLTLKDFPKNCSLEILTSFVLAITNSAPTEIFEITWNSDYLYANKSIQNRPNATFTPSAIPPSVLKKLSTSFPLRRSIRKSAVASKVVDEIIDLMLCIDICVYITLFIYFNTGNYNLDKLLCYFGTADPHLKEYLIGNI
jgi:hypothetical protein